MTAYDVAAFAEFNTGVARARLHARVLPISSVRGSLPLCAGGCGKHLHLRDTGKTCQRCINAAETRNRR